MHDKAEAQSSTTSPPKSSRKTIRVDGLVFYLAFSLASILSYVYVVLSSWTLSADEFGVFNTLLGLIAISGFFASSLQLAVAQAAVSNPTRSALMALVLRTCQIAFPGVALITAAAIPFASTIGATRSQVVCAGIVAFVVFVACAATGFLIGIGRVRSQAGINLLGTMLQVSMGWLLMRAGFGVNGVVLGYLINYAAIFICSYWISWRFAADNTSIASGDIPSIRLHRSSVATFVLAFCPFSLDQLLVQYFAPSFGGSYAALATMVRPVFYSSYPIIAVAYPHLLRLTDDDSRIRLLLAALCGVCCVSGVFALAILAFPEQLISMLFSDRFPDIVHYAGSLAFGVAGFSVSALGAHALIAARNPLGFLPSLMALVIQVGMFAFRHDSLAAIVSNQIWTYAIQLILVIAFIAVPFKRSIWRDQK